MANTNQRGRTQQQAATQSKEVEDAHDVERGHETADQAGAAAHDVPRDDASSMTWRRPSALDAPPARPGMVQRWKRYMLENEHDSANWSRAIREGWRPVRAENVDEAFHYMGANIGNYGECITAQGLVLCEMPRSMAEQRSRYYDDASLRLKQGVNEDLDRAQLADNPIQRDRKSRVDTGRRPTVAD